MRVSAYEQVGVLLRREGQHALSSGSGDAAHLVPAILEHIGALLPRLYPIPFSHGVTQVRFITV